MTIEKQQQLTGKEAEKQSLFQNTRKKLGNLKTMILGNKKTSRIDNNRNKGERGKGRLEGGAGYSGGGIGGGIRGGFENRGSLKASLGGTKNKEGGTDNKAKDGNGGKSSFRGAGYSGGGIGGGYR